MGQSKALLDWCSVPLVAYQVHSLREGGAEDVVVVVGHESNPIVPLVEAAGGRVALNPNYHLGKTTSIRAGIDSLRPDVSTVLVLSVDQPRRPTLIAGLIGTHLGSQALITAPTYHGHRGHPLLFDTVLLPELESVQEETKGIRQIMRTHANDINALEVEDAMVGLDLNTMREYTEAHRRFCGRCRLPETSRNTDVT